MQSQDEGDDIVISTDNEASLTSPDLVKLDMLIVQTDDGDKGYLKPHDYCDGDGDDVMDQDDESHGVQEDREEFEGILRNESNADDDEDDFSMIMLLGLIPMTTGTQLLVEMLTTLEMSPTKCSCSLVRNAL